MKNLYPIIRSIYTHSTPLLHGYWELWLGLSDNISIAKVFLVHLFSTKLSFFYITFFGLCVNNSLAHFSFIIAQISFERISEQGGNTQISVYQPQNYWQLGYKIGHHTTMQIWAMSLPVHWGILELRSAGGVCIRWKWLWPCSHLAQSSVGLSESKCVLVTTIYYWPHSKRNVISSGTLRGKWRLPIIGGCQLTTLFETGSKIFWAGALEWHSSMSTI